jgi:hypothetical protein
MYLSINAKPVTIKQQWIPISAFYFTSSQLNKPKHCIGKMLQCFHCHLYQCQVKSQDSFLITETKTEKPISSPYLIFIVFILWSLLPSNTILVFYCFVVMNEYTHSFHQWWMLSTLNIQPTADGGRVVYSFTIKLTILLSIVF